VNRPRRYLPVQGDPIAFYFIDIANSPALAAGLIRPVTVTHYLTRVAFWRLAASQRRSRYAKCSIGLDCETEAAEFVAIAAIMVVDGDLVGIIDDRLVNRLHGIPCRRSDPLQLADRSGPTPNVSRLTIREPADLSPGGLFVS
jgi:hypothetical protein